MKSVRDEPLLSQIFLEIGETDRLKLFALSAVDVVRTGAGGLQNTKRLTLTSPSARGPADTGRLSRGGKKSFSASVIVSESPPTPAPVLSPSPPGGVHGLPLEIQDSQRDGEILGNSGLGKF